MAARLSELIAPAFFPVHADVKRRGHGEYWLGGGRGSGKSSFASVELLLILMRDPELNGAVFRKVAATIRDSVLEQLIWASRMLGVEALWGAKVTPPEMVYLPTGQRILFRGADDPGKAKSLKLARGHFGCLWFEELTEFSGMEDVRTIKASVVRGGEAATFLSYNPPISAGNWVNAEAAHAVPGRFVHKSDYRMMPPAWLGEGFIRDAETLEQSDERAYRHMYLGEAVGTGAQVFENLTIREVGDGEIASCDRAYCGLDFGFAVDSDAFVRLSYDGRLSRLMFLDEFCEVRAPIDRLADEVLRRLDAGEHVICDSADPRMIDELRRRGVRALAAKKGPGSVERGIRRMQEMREIVIDPARCPNAAREFARYEYARGPGGAVIAAYPDRDNHLIDAARYALEPVTAAREAKAVDRRKLGI